MHERYASSHLVRASHKQNVSYENAFSRWEVVGNQLAQLICINLQYCVVLPSSMSPGTASSASITASYERILGSLPLTLWPVGCSANADFSGWNPMPVHPQGVYWTKLKKMKKNDTFFQKKWNKLNSFFKNDSILQHFCFVLLAMIVILTCFPFIAVTSAFTNYSYVV